MIGLRFVKNLLDKWFIQFHNNEFSRHLMKFISSNNIKGDYFEFGVWSGDSLIAAYHSAREFSLDEMRFFAFDSFQGIPKINGDDKGGILKEGGYMCGIEDFKRKIKSYGVDLNRVIIVKGWYDKLLDDNLKKKLKLKKAAIVYIDCILYESTVPVLDFVTNLIQDGTLIIFHGWFDFKGRKDKGEQKAFYEWLKKNPSFSASEYQKGYWSANSFIIHKKLKKPRC